VQYQREAARPEPLSHPVQSRDVVEVPVAEDDGLERGRVQAQPVEIADQPVRGGAGVVEHVAQPAAIVDLDERGESVFGT
jgi:hypothetical protein